MAELDPPTGDGPGPDLNPVGFHTWCPRLESKGIEMTRLTRIGHLSSHPPDDHAPPCARRRVDPIDLEYGIRDVNQGVELRPGGGAEDHR